MERLDYFVKEDRVAVYLSMSLYKSAREYCRNNLVILDLGCGFGWGTKYLSQQGVVYGVDIDKETIAKVKDRYKNDKELKFICADALNLPFGNEKFDLVVSIENIEHVKDQTGYIKEVKRVLKKGGTLILSTPNREHLGHKIRRLLKYEAAKNPFHLHEFSENELSELLVRNGFQIVKKERFLFCLPLRLLKYVEKSSLLVRCVTKFTLPGCNCGFLVVGRLK